MAFKLLETAQERRRKLDGSELLPQVRAGMRFVDGVRPEREKKSNERRRKAA